MVNKVLFDHLTSGIVNGLVKSGFGIGDGLDYESGSSDESDGEYVLRAFYYDKETELQHTIKVNVTVEIESIEDEDEDD
jgi:hypothetical protein